MDFVESFNQLSKLFADTEQRPQVDPNSVSRASTSTAHAGIGPQGIFPGVQVAAPARALPPGIA